MALFGLVSETVPVVAIGDPGQAEGRGGPGDGIRVAFSNAWNQSLGCKLIAPMS